MDAELRELEIESKHAAAELLALNWSTSKAKVRAAVDEMLAGTKLSTSSMGYLLKQTSKLPVQDEPARKLHDFVTAVSALHGRKSAAEYSQSIEMERGAAYPLASSPSLLPLTTF